MDNERALDIINALASGIDPFTGEVFPQESALQNPETVRALFLAARALEQEPGRRKSSSKSRPKDPSLPGNTGKPWSDVEDLALVSAFESGSTEKDLAASHQRTPGAIRSRLVKLGKLEPAAS